MCVYVGAYISRLCTCSLNGIPSSLNIYDIHVRGPKGPSKTPTHKHKHSTAYDLKPTTHSTAQHGTLSKPHIACDVRQIGARLVDGCRYVCQTRISVGCMLDGHALLARTAYALFFTEKIPPMRSISDRYLEKNTPYAGTFFSYFSPIWGI